MMLLLLRGEILMMMDAGFGGTGLRIAHVGFYNVNDTISKMVRAPPSSAIHGTVCVNNEPASSLLIRRDWWN